MKLSEAIMMNGITKPQGFGPNSFYSQEAPCAVGGALQVVGATQTYTAIYDLWQWTYQGLFKCPACARTGAWPVNAIIHLNDHHHWPRAQIAKWVASVEPTSPDVDKTEKVEIVEHETVLTS